MWGLFSIGCLVLGAGIGFLIPTYAYRYASWKSKKRGKSMPIQNHGLLWRLLGVAIIGTYTWIAFVYVSPWKLVFCMVFISFGLFGTIVDNQIRIIGNEMLLCMLALGIFYRAIDGGVRSFLGAGLALVLVVAVFALAAYITFILKRVRGVGMGDVKLAMVIAITIGFEKLPYFIFGMSIAMLIFVVYRVVINPIFIHTYMHEANVFPMCAPIMCGLMTALVLPEFFASYGYSLLDIVHIIGGGSI